MKKPKPKRRDQGEEVQEKHFGAALMVIKIGLCVWLIHRGSVASILDTNMSRLKEAG